MCFGLEAAWLPALISAGLSGVGTAISANSAQKDARNRAQARNAQLIQQLDEQKGYADEARGLVDQRLEEYSPQSQSGTLGEATQKREAALTSDIAQTAPSATALSGSAPKVVESAIASSMRKALGESTQQAQNQAKLGSYGQSWFDAGLKDAQLGRGIDTINNFSKSSAGMLPSLQDLAEQEVAKPPSVFGQLLTGLGGAVGSFAGGGGFGGGAVKADPWAGLRGGF